MQQTLLTIGALVIAMFFALTSQERAVHLETERATTEVETMAGQAAMNVLAHIAAQPYDAAVVAGPVESPELLTPAAQFPTGLPFREAADVDDFNEMAPYTYATLDGVEFELTAEVGYLDDDLQPSAVPTYQKEVVVYVSHPSIPSDYSVSRVVTWP